MKFYCLAVQTSKEDQIKKLLEEKLEAEVCKVKGTIHLFKKLMRLKNGKMYDVALFPGYLFLMTDCEEPRDLGYLLRTDGVFRYLPNSFEPSFLKGRDEDIVRELINSGNTLKFVRAKFNENDRIVIVDGPFKNLSGKITSVNRRNHRVNIQLDFLNGMKLIGLTYFDIEKEDWSAEEKAFLNENAKS